MKHLKKIVSLLLTAIMVLAMCVPVMADTVSVETPSDLPDHSYVAYQIFKGTQSEDKGALGQVEWGSGINSTSFLAALKSDSVVGKIFENCSDADDVKSVVTALSTIASKSSEAKVVAKLAFANKKGNGTSLNSGDNTLETGYYLIVDTTDVSGEGKVANAALLQVTSSIKIEKKTDKPSVEKKVKENNKYNNENNEYGIGYNDVADYNMGDEVPFHLIGTVPDMSNYDTYKYIFHDTLSKGLTVPDAGNVKVYLSNDKKVDKDADVDITVDFRVSVSEKDRTITVSCNDLKSVNNKSITKNQYIIVEYSAILNQNAVVGLDGNENEVKLEYSNKPDYSGNGDSDNTGETPEDKVIVFTYELDTTKVDGQNTTQKLSGAKFKLKNDKNQWAVVTDKKITGWVNDESTATELESAGDGENKGLFKVTGLDDGKYFLKETKAPDGYNILTDLIEFTINATTKNNQSWNQTPKSALEKLEITVIGKTQEENTTTEGDIKTGIVSLTVKNNKGATLPETGGIGTTIFYVVGVVLMLGAGVLLVTKKRMNSNH